MVQSRRSLSERYLYGQRCRDLHRPHAITFSVALDRVTVAEKQVRAFFIDSQHDSVASGNFLNVKIAAMCAIIYGENRAVDRRDADYADHRLHRQLDVFVPMHKVVLDLDAPCLDA